MSAQLMANQWTTASSMLSNIPSDRRETRTSLRFFEQATCVTIAKLLSLRNRCAPTLVSQISPENQNCRHIENSGVTPPCKKNIARRNVTPFRGHLCCAHLCLDGSPSPVRAACTTKFNKTDPSRTSLTMTPGCAMESAIFCVRSISRFKHMDRPKNFFGLMAAMKAGAIEFLCKPAPIGTSAWPVMNTTGISIPSRPSSAWNSKATHSRKSNIKDQTSGIREQDLLDAVRAAINKDFERRAKQSSLGAMQKHYITLTPREKEVMAMVVTGMMNKQIAAKLDIAEITVKVHRASLLRKMDVKSLAELVREADTLAGPKHQPKVHLGITVPLFA